MEGNGGAMEEHEGAMEVPWRCMEVHGGAWGCMEVPCRCMEVPCRCHAVGIDFYEIMFLKSRTCFLRFLLQIELGLMVPRFWSAASGLPPSGRPKWSSVRIPWKKMSFFDFS